MKGYIFLKKKERNQKENVKNTLFELLNLFGKLTSQKISICNWESDSMPMYNTSFVKETELSFTLACCHEHTGLVGEE